MSQEREPHDVPRRNARADLRDPALGQADTTALFECFRRTGDRRVRNELVARHRWLAAIAAQRFARRGEPLDDLQQVAVLGLLKAVERFDPAHGAPFTSFAMPTVVGELRRHFRDRTWSLHVNRRAKELHLEVAGATDALTRRLQRAPRLAELAAELRASEDDTLHALTAGRAYRAASLHARPAADGALVEPAGLSTEHRELALAADRVALQQVLRRLPPRQQRIVVLRFFGGLKQAEIADQLGISQVHVSRLLRAALRTLRSLYGEDAAPAVAG